MKKFTAAGRVTVEVGLEIEAADLTEALEKAKALKLEDFITILGEHNDSSALKIVSVWDQSYIKSDD